MKNFMLAISILWIAQAFSQEKIQSEALARIQGHEFTFVGDTLKLKNDVLRLMSASIDKDTPLTVEIRQGKTFGEAIEDYYFVLLHSKRDHVTIAKWLEKVEDNLFLVNDFTGGNYWQVLTTACIGKDDCAPQVAVIDGQKHWGCGSKLVCSADNACTKVSALETP